jgi:hypothetical protein
VSASLSLYTLLVVTALKQTVTVQQGGRIEIRSSELSEGSQAEVIILVEEVKRTIPLASMIGKGEGSFDSPESVDDYLREESDSYITARHYI